MLFVSFVCSCFQLFDFLPVVSPPLPPPSYFTHGPSLSPPSTNYQNRALVVVVVVVPVWGPGRNPRGPNRSSTRGPAAIHSPFRLPLAPDRGRHTFAPTTLAALSYQTEKKAKTSKNIYLFVCRIHRSIVYVLLAHRLPQAQLIALPFSSLRGQGTRPFFRTCSRSSP